MKKISLDEFRILLRSRKQILVLSPSGNAIAVTKKHAIEWFEFANKSGRISFINATHLSVWIGDEKPSPSSKDYPFETFIVGGLQ